MRATLFIIWFLTTTSDATAAVMAAVYLRRVRETRFSRYLAFCFVCIAVESGVAALSLLLLWPNEADASPAFALIRVAGRTVKSVGVWALVLYLLNFCNGKKEAAEAEATGSEM